MNHFQNNEFFMHESNIEDHKTNSPPLPSNQSNFIELSTSNSIATSSVGDDYLHYPLFIDQNLSSAKLGESIILDEHSFINFPNESSSPSTFSSIQNASITSSLTARGEMDFLEVPELSSDMVFNYISQILLEENMDDKFDVYTEHPALLAAEKPFYDILGEKFPPLPHQDSIRAAGSSDDSISELHVNSNTNGVLASNSWPYDPLEYHQLQTNPVYVDYSSSQSSFSPTTSAGNVNGVLEEPILFVNDLVTQSSPAWQFQKGVEEARRFLPSNEKLVIDLEVNGFHFPKEPKEDKKLIEMKVGNEKREDPIHASRGRKTHHDDDLDLQEGRINKQLAFSTEQPLQSELDEVLLFSHAKCSITSDQKQAESENETSKSSHSKGGKGRGKRQPKQEVVDLRTLLLHCAQSVAIDDRRSAYEQLKQIRQHSSPFGDANQRMAHCFADGLEARLAGTGSQIYHSIMAKGISTIDKLKAYRLYMNACPFKKIFYFYSNKTIMDVAENATRLHIIDFGIYHGFQWPCFMQRLASRPGGPPRLRMTGIDTPMPGFRPTQRVDETGNRLADYAKRFDIPFEFHAIAAKWETIRVEDLNIDKDEVLVVNSLFPFNNLMDETVVEDSPRNMVLKLIKNLNPAVYIFAIVNGAYNSPFFVTRFRETLFYYSSMFDMIETNVPREDETRLLIEKSILGPGALNVIACEGLERVDRPETYKQWQVRNFRAGFEQLPLNPDMIQMANEKLKSYHKDFVIDVDGKWLLQGWKGRITMALSTWVSRHSS
ncbi:hypothetical protein Cni_G27472 [Canna indica]|uniref:Uncharacterized protein n=1 Tax=Canna indica TaxID=4628 RepID=A0AAQ3QS96_9LILI|nr:hypothetical protein Cni_G27472 [Canna indica]